MNGQTLSKSCSIDNINGPTGDIIRFIGDENDSTGDIVG
jgi:hypothetical protein